MNKIETFENFLTTQSIQVPVFDFVLNLVLALILAYILEKIYIKFGKALSNRTMFASNFLVLAATTMLIISIVKSSLALSLGLVGALSIVRFRSAIKEPEELTYLFLTIAIGLGFGANQRLITIVGFIVVAVIIILKNYSKRSKDDYNVYVTVSGNTQTNVDLDRIVNVLNEHCSMVILKRFDENQTTLEALFLVEFSNFDQVVKSKSVLRNLDEDCVAVLITSDKVYKNVEKSNSDNKLNDGLVYYPTSVSYEDKRTDSTDGVVKPQTLYEMFLGSSTVTANDDISFDSVIQLNTSSLLTNVYSRNLESFSKITAFYAVILLLFLGLV